MFLCIEEPDLKDLYQMTSDRFKNIAKVLYPNANISVTPLISCLLKTLTKRELDLRQFINKIPNALLLPTSNVSDRQNGNRSEGASGKDLDNLAVLFGVSRRVVQDEELSVSPPIPKQLETDECLVGRILDALKVLSCTGTRDSYRIKLLNVASALVKEVKVISPKAGIVKIIILPQIHILKQFGTKLIKTMGQWHPGKPDTPLDLPFYTKHWFDGRFDSDTPESTQVTGIKPMIDRYMMNIGCVAEKVNVTAPSDIVTYQIEATVTFMPTANSEQLENEIMKDLIEYVKHSYKLGGSFSISQIKAIIDRPEVIKIFLISPKVEFFKELVGKDRDFRDSLAVSCEFEIKEDLVVYGIKVNNKNAPGQKMVHSTKG